MIERLRQAAASLPRKATFTALRDKAIANLDSSADGAHARSAGDPAAIQERYDVLRGEEYAIEDEDGRFLVKAASTGCRAEDGVVMRRIPSAKVASVGVTQTKLAVERDLDWLFREQPTEDGGQGYGPGGASPSS